MNLELFKNNEFGRVRVIKDEKDEVWFVLSDVCKCLGLSNPTKVANSLDKDDLTTIQVIDNMNRKQKVNAVNESGLYQVIFQSRKPEAKKFKRWVTTEVLPTIRKTGGYVSDSDLFINTYLPFADDNTKLLFKQTLEVIRKQNEKIEADKPKVAYFDDLVDRNLKTNLTDTAKELGFRPKAFNTYLYDNKYLYKRGGSIKYYTSPKTAGLFEYKEFINPYNSKSGQQVMVTPKGRETFNLLKKQIADYLLSIDFKEKQIFEGGE